MNAVEGSDQSNSGDLLRQLEPAVGDLVERHYSLAKGWNPHEFVPWSRGRDFEPDEEWDPAEAQMPAEVRQALIINLLTEDGLPYYFSTLEREGGTNKAWGEWSRHWTAEEMRHATVIRDYLTVTRSVDPTALEQRRMQFIKYGFHQPIEGEAELMAYTPLQELATRISHRNTGKLLKDAAGQKVMFRVAMDENLHFLFYRDLVSAALEIDPSTMVKAIERQVRLFQMPGAGIDGFSAAATAIAEAGIYDLPIHHDQILLPVVVRDWRIEELEGLNPAAERAREALVIRIDRIGKAARRFSERREERRAAAANESKPVAMVPGEEVALRQGTPS